MRDRAPGDAGSIAPMVAILMVAFLALVGLVIDSSRQLTARARATAYAQEAARAGAQAVDPAGDPLVIDPVAAAARVRGYCARARASEPHLTACAPVAIDAERVSVTVRIAMPSGLLGIVGITTLRATGDGTARPLIGVDTPDG